MADRRTLGSHMIAIDDRQSRTIEEVRFYMIADDRRIFCDLRSVILDGLRSYENQPLR